MVTRLTVPQPCIVQVMITHKLLLSLELLSNEEMIEVMEGHGLVLGAGEAYVC